VEGDDPESMGLANSTKGESGEERGELRVFISLSLGGMGRGLGDE